MATPNRGLFVCGTDTGVGKTLVACAIIKSLRAINIDAVGFKPAASGSVDGRWADADALYEASGRCEPPELICPLRFDAPLAPTMAAPRENRTVDLKAAREALEQLRGRHAAVVVEGVGGVLVPLDEHTLVIDFMRETGYPAVLVCRAALGTINHTLLTLNELDRAKISVCGIIMNATQSIDERTWKETQAEIERLSGRRIACLAHWTGKREAAEAMAPFFHLLGVSSWLGCA